MALTHKNILYLLCVVLVGTIVWSLKPEIVCEKQEAGIMKLDQETKSDLIDSFSKKLSGLSIVTESKTQEKPKMLPFPGNVKIDRLESDSATVHFIYDYPNIQPRAWCAIESLCRLNISVKIITSNSQVFDSFTKNCSITYIPLDYANFFHKTPLESWFRDTKFEEANGLAKFDLTDAARLAILYKYGGIYSDLDIIFFNRKMLDTKNKLSAQLDLDQLWHGHHINGNFLDFEIGHPFLLLAMQKFARGHNVNHNWGDFGPELITGTLRECLYDPQSRHMCEQIERLRYTRFQYIQPGTLKKELNEAANNQRSLMEEMMKFAYGLHFSNSEIGHEPMTKDGLLHELMKNYCPIVEKKYQTELFEPRVQVE